MRYIVFTLVLKRLEILTFMPFVSEKPLSESYFIGNGNKRTQDDTTTKPDTVHHSQAVESAVIPTYRRHHGNRMKCYGIRDPEENKQSLLVFHERESYHV